MRRREFITILGSAVVVWPLSAHAQPGERMRSIGVLTPLPADLADAQERHAVFLQTLRQLGWTEGGNVRIEARWSAGNPAIARKYAAELVALAPDVIVATGQFGRCTRTAGNPLHTCRVRNRSRSSRRWVCRESRGARRQCHWLYDVRI